MSETGPSTENVIAATRDWLERVVIGLNLCPFAKGVYVKNQVRIAVSDATNTDALLDELERELRHLQETPAAHTDTTVLVVPGLFADFDGFVDFLDLAEIVMQTYGFAGELQIASFHPDYLFADADTDDDLANNTNRAPYPTLHLIREASLAKATAAFPDAADIYERNIEVARALGEDGWLALGVRSGSPPKRK
jgi:hypothetical protein